MKHMPNTYFIVLDALRSDHVKYMPWLSSKVNNGVYVKNIEISSGFCERSEIFFSLKPKKTGFLNAINIDIGLKSPNRPYYWFSRWPKSLLIFMEKNKFFQKIIRRILWKISITKSFYGMYPQRIPLNILDKITLTEDAIDFEEYSNNIKSGLLYFFIKNGYHINWKYFTSLSSNSFGTDTSRLHHISKHIADYKNSFIPIYISSPDAIGHKFGPHSNELVKALNILDEKLKVFYNSCIENDSKSCVCFLGDHGMEEVQEGINIESIIHEISTDLGFKPQKDFYYFLDSTILRIWWNSNNKNDFNKLYKALISHNKLQEKGYFINDKNFHNEGLPNLKEIADIVWWAKKGIQISPDFFHSEYDLKAGMHGYLKKDGISSGFFLMLKDDIIKKSYEKLEITHLSDIL
jgi:predicted AlkP superfamily pyrophosphatase or phosphodiesterase